MANSSILHLVIEKGPKQGETLTHKPGTLIRIGRVVKGNTFAIKDLGISQRHLSIEFMSGISKWAVKDLDTSNGTLVNDIKIPPLTPFPLSGGDTIKIGETTSITIAVEGDGSEIDSEAKRVRRIGRWIGDSVEEDICIAEMKNLGIGRSRRGNSSRVTKKDVILDVVVDDGVKIRSRRGNSSRVCRKENILDTVVEGSVQLRSGRGNYSRVSNKNDKKFDVVIEESIEMPKIVKRGRSKKAPPPPRTSPAKIMQSGDMGEVIGKNNRTGVEEENEVDFEKMTLGEWFDSMEKYLPNAINEVAEQMIEILKEKARCFDEYVTNLPNTS